MTTAMNLFCFGLGFSAQALIANHRQRFASISGTVRTGDKAKRLHAEGINAMLYSGGAASGILESALDSCTSLLVSAAPDEAGDPMLRHLSEPLMASEGLKTIVYLSTVGVYGDQQGRWVDETATLNPGSERARRRVQAEQAWLAFGQKKGVAIQIHRLAGIYGPGRNALEDMKDGSARRIIKDGQVFNRIHVADIAGAAMAGFENATVSGAFNVCDDAPGPPQDVVAFAAELLGMPVPPDTPFAEAKLSEMGRSFYAESKRCSNARLKAELGYALRYPTYREGLTALAADMTY
ncbi:MAG: SDR family oxidoreductase [Beijerinckiaceae bacterium]